MKRYFAKAVSLVLLPAAAVSACNTGEPIGETVGDLGYRETWTCSASYSAPPQFVLTPSGVACKTVPPTPPSFTPPAQSTYCGQLAGVDRACPASTPFACDDSAKCFETGEEATAACGSKGCVGCGTGDPKPTVPPDVSTLGACTLTKRRFADALGLNDAYELTVYSGGEKLYGAHWGGKAMDTLSIATLGPQGGEVVTRLKGVGGSSTNQGALFFLELTGISLRPVGLGSGEVWRSSGGVLTVRAGTSITSPGNGTGTTQPDSGSSDPAALCNSNNNYYCANYQTCVNRNCTYWCTNKFSGNQCWTSMPAASETQNCTSSVHNLCN